jgi:putative spermidine/putrescine transport system permease protein
VRFDQRILLLLIVPAGVLALVVWGIVSLFVMSLTVGGQWSTENYTALFARPDYIAMFGRTFLVAAETSALSLLLAYPTAYYIARMKRRRDLALLFIILPWLVSLVVRTFGWIVLLGNHGIINDSLLAAGVIGSPLRLMFNEAGVLIGMVHVFCPFMILAILNSFLHLERSMEEAAVSLGAGPFTTFRRIVLPLTMPGVVNGVILVFLISTGAVVTPLMLGGVRDSLIGTQIYREVIDIFDLPKAAALAVILTLIALVLVTPLQWIERYVSRHLKQPT